MNTIDRNQSTEVESVGRCFRPGVLFVRLGVGVGKDDMTFYFFLQKHKKRKISYGLFVWFWGSVWFISSLFFFQGGGSHTTVLLRTKVLLYEVTPFFLLTDWYRSLCMGSWMYWFAVEIGLT